MTLIDRDERHFYTAAVDRVDRGRLSRIMSLNSKLRLGLLSALLASGVGIALAQPAATGAAGGFNSAGSPDNRGEANLSPAQMRQQAGQYLPTMEQSGQTIRRQLDQAREARDVVKVLCLNDKLNQVDVAVRSARDRVASLSSAAERGDAERSRHEFTVIQVLRDRVRSLAQEANQCIGEETGEIGDHKVVVAVDPATPKDSDAFSSAQEPPPSIATPPTLMSSPL